MRVSKVSPKKAMIPGAVEFASMPITADIARVFCAPDPCR
jgi:hypothetical protein